MSNIKGNDQKKHADLYIKGKHIGRITYYYWSEEGVIIRFHDKNKYIIAQIFKDEVNVIFNEDIEDVIINSGE